MMSGQVNDVLAKTMPEFEAAKPVKREVQEQRQNVAVAEREPVAAVIKDSPGITESSVSSAVENVNTKLAPLNTEIAYTFHESTNRVSFKILDKETGNVLREIPPEEILNMMEKLYEMAGILIDQRS